MVRAGPHGSSRLMVPWRGDSLPELFGGSEEGYLLRRNVHRIAGSGVTSFSSFAAPGQKTPEASQLDSVSFPQGVGNAPEENVNDGLSLPPRKVDPVGNSRSQFRLCHFFSPSIARVPQRQDHKPFLTTGSVAARAAQGHRREPAWSSALCAPMTVIPCFSTESHSSSFDQRRRPETLRTAMATAFFWPTSTTKRLPRVTPV